MKQTIEPHHFEQEAQRIRKKTSTILTKWGLKPRFKRWRLTQDPDTGMIVLFGILNNSYIATHTSIPFGNYFDPRLLDDLAKNIQLQVVSCNSDGLRYAFILDRGHLDKLPTHIDFPYIDSGKFMVRVVYNEPPQSVPAQPVEITKLDDQALVRQGVGAFLKVFDDIKLRDDAALQLSAQSPPEIVVIEKDEFNKRVAELEVNRQRINHIRRLLLGGNLVGGKLELSKKMQEAILYVIDNGGKLSRYRGGFWAMENWHRGQHPWFGTSTVKALVSRGLMSYTEWQEGRNGSFPIASVLISELLDMQT